MSAAVLRAARADLRARPFQTLLIVVAVACAAATLSLALGVRGAANGPWDRLHRATNGAHVLASGSDLTSLAGLPACSDDEAQNKANEAGEKVKSGAEKAKTEAEKAKEKAEKAKKDVDGQ